jgi:hypothetical protein
MIRAIIPLVLFISFVECIFLTMAFEVEDLSFFNPIRNYKKWTSMNWFGVIFFTLLLHTALPLYAIGYWFYKLCTVGRKK